MPNFDDSIRPYQIPYPKIPHIRYYLDHIHYRTPHQHNAFEILLILDGRVNILTDSGNKSFSKNDMLILNTNEIHELSCDEDSVTLLSLQISPSFCAEYFPSLRRTIFLQSSISDMLTPEERVYLSNLLLSSAYCYFTMFGSKRYRVVSLTAMILDFIESKVPNRQVSIDESVAFEKKAARINRIISYIQEHFTEPQLLQKLARDEKLTSTYLSTFFSKNFHISFREYLLRYRLEKAMQLLCTTDLPILDVCYECGFTDYRQLNRFCNQEYGQSASACRNIALINRSQPFNPQNAQIIEYLFSDQEALDYIASHVKLFPITLPLGNVTYALTDEIYNLTLEV